MWGWGWEGGDKLQESWWDLKGFRRVMDMAKGIQSFRVGGRWGGWRPPSRLGANLGAVSESFFPLGAGWAPLMGGGMGGHV